MSITPITTAWPACYGVCCPVHAQCLHYLAAEGADADRAIATCDDHNNGQRPLFLPAKFSGEAA